MPRWTLKACRLSYAADASAKAFSTMSLHIRRHPRLTRRFLLIGAGQAAIFGLLADHLYRLQVLKHPHYMRVLGTKTVVKSVIIPERGIITDTSGVVLARSAATWRLSILPNPWADGQRLLKGIAATMPGVKVNFSRVARILEGPPRSSPIEVASDLSWTEIAKLEVDHSQLRGIIIEREFSRAYPLAGDTAHVVGYLVPPSKAEAKASPLLAMPGMKIGGSGIERARNDVLIGKPGFLELASQDGDEPLKIEQRVAAIPGDTVALTLDMELQRAAVAALAKRPGALVLLDATTGAIKAMASTPTFDPNYFNNGVPAAVWSGWMAEAQRPLLNRASQGLYAPGSTFKPTVALSALQCEAISPSTRFFCSGQMKIGDKTFYCWKRSGHGSMHVRAALQQSCDIFFYNVAMQVGIDKIAAAGDQLGLIGKPQLDFPNLASSFVPSSAWVRAQGMHWTLGNTAIQGIGQGYTLCSPLSLAVMAARIASGTAVAPFLTQSIGGTEIPQRPVVPLTAAPAHLGIIRQGMDEVVNTPLGTSWGGRLDIAGIRMAGKTGTAQVISESAAMEAANFDDSRLPWKYRPNALFIGYAPLGAPRYAVAVVIEHGALLDPVIAARDVFTRCFQQAQET